MAARRRGPSMYEMEGPRLVAQPSTPIAQLPVTRLLSAADPTTSAARPPRTPGCPLVPAFRGLPRSSGVSPGSASVLGGECFSTASPTPRTRDFGQQSQDSLVIHRTPAVIPRVPRLSTTYPPVYPHTAPQYGATGRVSRRAPGTSGAPACRRTPQRGVDGRGCWGGPGRGRTGQVR